MKWSLSLLLCAAICGSDAFAESKGCSVIGGGSNPLSPIVRKNETATEGISVARPVRGKEILQAIPQYAGRCENRYRQPCVGYG
jgi:hypothetical protein